MSRDSDDHWFSAMEARFCDLGLDQSNDPTQANATHAAIIRRELESMARAMCVFARRSNALLPVGHLPPEILSRIFAQCALVDRHGRPWIHGKDGSDRAPFSLGWIKVTHVCHRWRETALEDASLWAHIDCSVGLTLAKAMLSRARTTPLDVRAIMENNVRGTKFDQVLILVSAELSLSTHISHIGQLIVRGRGATFTKVKSWLSSPAPALDTLVLDGPFLGSSPMRPLPADILVNAPNLRRLFLIGSTISWPKNVAHNLTHLRISPPWPSDVQRSGQFPPAPFQEFYSCLRTMPGLQYLVLEMCLPNPSEAHGAVVEIVKLPNLRFLAIAGSTIECVDFMARIFHPPATALRFVFHCFNDSANQFPAAVRLLTQAVGTLDRSSPPSQMWHRVNISSTRRPSPQDRRYIGFKAYNKVQAPDGSLPNDVDPLTKRPYPFHDTDEPSIGKEAQLSFSWIDFTPELIPQDLAYMQQLVDVLPTDANVRMLFIHVDDAAIGTPRTWLDMSTRFQDVEHIRIMTTGVMVAFCRASDEGEGAVGGYQRVETRTRHVPFFPNLSRIDVEAHVLGRGAPYRAFLGYLDARRLRNKPLQQLAIQGLSMQRDRLPALRELVTSLEAVDVRL